MTKLLATLVALCFVVSCSVAQGDKARTQYETFDLSTPEAAVTTFVDTFHARDYAGLFLIFHPLAQQNWIRYAAVTFDYSGWFNADGDTLQALVSQVFDAFDEGVAEHDVSLTTYRFDAAMILAEENNVLPVDLRGVVKQLNTEMLDNMEGTAAARITVEVEEIEGEVVFVLLQSPSGRWRVYQVLLPNGDETKYPWGVSSK
ncbi:MAG: hypothetical protein JNJ61_07360 [Anaerolineae bacterium]|nr:hypothetical protein [Anaerolineae bacterium]